MPTKKLELTFKAYGKDRAGGRWCKKIDLKTYYFGGGRNRSDRKSYKAALEKYRQFRNSLDEASVGVSAFFAALEREGKRDEVFIKADGPENEESRTELVDMQWDLRRRRMLEVLRVKHTVRQLQPDAPTPQLHDAFLEAWELAADPGAVDKLVAPPKPGGVTITEMIQDWLASEHLRFKAGEISKVGYLSKQRGIKNFSDFVGKASFGHEAAVASLITGYREKLLKALSSGTYSANTVNDKLKFLNQFIHWCHRNHRLSELPRNLSDVTRMVKVKKAGQPLDLDTVHRLFHAADDRLKCWIALGLNCGFKNGDIAELTADNLEIAGRLVGYRHKTSHHADGGVPMNYQLWPSTQQLLEATRQDRDGGTDGRVFVNAHGNPLVTSGGTDRVGHAFKRLADGLGITATFQQLRDTGAEAARKLLAEQGRVEPALIQVYLAHKDSSTAAFYLSNDPRQMVTRPLDDLLTLMDTHFNLVTAPGPA